MPLDALYQEVKHDRLQRLLQFYADGTYRPFIWPWDTLPALYLFLGLLVLPRVSDGTAKVVRPLLIVLILGQGLWTCIRCRTIGMAGGYGIGLANDWGFIMTGALLVFNDVKRDFKRLEKRADAGKDGPATQNGSMKAQALDRTANAGIRRRRETDGSTLASATTSSTKVTTSLMWKEYPDHIGHCMGWIIDLLISFRGVNWSFRLPTFAPIDNIAPPFPDKKQLKSSRAFPVDPSLQQVQRNALRSFVFLCFAVDLAKTLVIHDPYYLGLASLDSPHPLWLLQPYKVLTRTVRVFLSLYSVIVALSLIVRPSPPSLQYTTISNPHSSFTSHHYCILSFPLSSHRTASSPPPLSHTPQCTHPTGPQRPCTTSRPPASPPSGPEFGIRCSASASPSPPSTCPDTFHTSQKTLALRSLERCSCSQASWRRQVFTRLQRGRASHQIPRIRRDRCGAVACSSCCRLSGSWRRPRWRECWCGTS